MRNRSFRDFEKMARVVVITKSHSDFVETTNIYGPYETAGIARAMATKITADIRYDDILDYWVEESELVIWHKVED